MMWQHSIAPREPTVDNHGIFARHDQRCAVYSGEHAVLNLNEGIFHPSWKAQRDGWRLVYANTWWKRTLVRLVAL